MLSSSLTSIQIPPLHKETHTSHKPMLSLPVSFTSLPLFTHRLAPLSRPLLGTPPSIPGADSNDVQQFLAADRAFDTSPWRASCRIDHVDARVETAAWRACNVGKRKEEFRLRKKMFFDIFFFSFGACVHPTTLLCVYVVPRLLSNRAWIFIFIFGAEEYDVYRTWFPTGKCQVGGWC
jgi:hypothetical protein